MSDLEKLAEKYRQEQDELEKQKKALDDKIHALHLEITKLVEQDEKNRMNRPVTYKELLDLKQQYRDEMSTSYSSQGMPMTPYFPSETSDKKTNSPYIVSPFTLNKSTYDIRDASRFSDEVKKKIKEIIEQSKKDVDSIKDIKNLDDKIKKLDEIQPEREKKLNEIRSMNKVIHDS